MATILERIQRRLKWHWWDIVHKSRPPHWVLQPCGDSGQILLRSNSIIAQIIFSMGYEEEEKQFLRRTLGPGMTVFDIGANVGWHTILTSQAVGPTGKVHAFEPIPDTFHNLQLNVTLNKLTQVLPQCLALSHEPGMLSFHIFPEGYDIYNSMGARERHEGVQAARQVLVPTTTLDDYCRERNLPCVDFLKIDVEGAEEFVLRGGQQVLQESPNPVILIELFEPSARQCGSSVGGAMELLQDLGFSPHSLNPDGIPVALSAAEYDITCQGENPNYNFVFLKSTR